MDNLNWQPVRRFGERAGYAARLDRDDFIDIDGNRVLCIAGDYLIRSIVGHEIIERASETEFHKLFEWAEEPT